MDIRAKKISLYLVFVYLVIFPFGQTFGFIFRLFYPNLPKLHLADLIVFLLVFITLVFNLGKVFRIRWFRPFILTSLVTVFTYLLSVNFLEISFLLGFLYLIRLFVYIVFFATCYILFKKKQNQKLILNSLIVVGSTITVFGLIQYFLIPDLRTLKLLGWDDHYFRLVSTFIDPTFTALLIVFTYLILLIKTLKTKKFSNLILILVLIAALGLTYSRSSFLAFFISNLFIIFNFVKHKKKYFLILVTLSLFVIYLLPKGSGGEGVNLMRVNSINQKIENSYQGINLFFENPLFGVGFNNICSVKTAQNNKASYSHSCSGFDNSLIFLLASTGVVGTLSYAWLFYNLWNSTTDDQSGLIWKASSISLITHTMFTNTIFYPWVMGWFALLTAISRKTDKSADKLY